ncbi:C40 family peptidase [Streptomyces gobiensis]|uniref:C40 family peptidase n=1 Tax=Streptomyces gobiensis TaxID=2875706 RepID=UPI001E545401|nr:C40 family peptidase [Streptomyces gobiensis]UGY92867.1 NlpC/P60 family protein [Streptomyces gobiensis]
MRQGTVLVCAVGVLAVSGGGAYAAPHKPPEPGPKSDSQSQSQAQAQSRSLEEVREEIEKLHDQAGSATDAYNAAAEKVKLQQREIVRLARRIDQNQGKLKQLNDQAGAMARAQYRSGGMPAGTRMVLERDPERFLHSLSLMQKGQQATRGVIGQLSTTQQALNGYAKAATARWEKLETSRKQRAAAKKRIEAKLKQAEKLESQLAEDELERLKELEEKTSYERQLKWLKSGVLNEVNAKASKQGKKAIAYATEQIGKDYKWGATGPGTFDCSGLTMRAWEAAGKRIPRTSQEQWKGLKKVSTKEMRPGDLIVYKKDASHIGMYLGDGEMVHAPRTGRQIRVEGAGVLPILGVVRPD